MCENCVLRWYQTENFLFSDNLYSDSTLILTAIATKWCIDIGARPDVCGVSLMFLVFVLTLADGLYTPSCVGAGVQR
jgi:hypothetical protein